MQHCKKDISITLDVNLKPQKKLVFAKKKVFKMIKMGQVCFDGIEQCVQDFFKPYNLAKITIVFIIIGYLMAQIRKLKILLEDLNFKWKTVHPFDPEYKIVRKKLEKAQYRVIIRKKLTALFVGILFWYIDYSYYVLLWYATFIFPVM